MRLVLVGPPGAGKGTQAALLTRRLGIPAVSTGDVLEGEIAAGSELGTAARGVMQRGELVPDDVVERMVAARLGRPDAAAGFLLDGFPRDCAQAEALDTMLAAAGRRLDAVVSLTVPDAQVLERIRRRAAEQDRVDDDEATARHRLQVFTEQTAPLVARYRRQGVLVQVDGTGSVDEVAERVVAALDAKVGR